MKILFVAHEQQVNGASKSLLELISIYKESHDIYVLTAYDHGAFYEALNHLDVKVIYLPYYRWVIKRGNAISWFIEKMKWYLVRLFVNHRTIKKVSNLVKSEKIDIVHVNSSVIHIGTELKKRTGVKHIWHIREFGDQDFDMFPYYSKIRYHQIMSENTDMYICNSRAVDQHFSFLPKEKKKVIYNGVSDQNVITRNKKDSNTVHLLLAGRYSLAKGQVEAINACQLLVEKKITNFVLHLAGSGTNKINIPINLQNKLILHGEVSDMPELRKKIDIELVCSRCEAFGRVTIEAMMGGIPVIGSNTGGTPELITDGVNGFLYEYGNIDQLAEKIQLLIQNPAMRNLMGEEALQFSSDFTVINCASSIERIYNEVLN